ncbi:MAG: DUF7544 domain-containing protein [Planctomycetota bacterium]|jgi:hypothetical protein
MTLQENQISVIDPISSAIERSQTILFRPFNIKKWFVIGFCAWLTYLGMGSWPNNFGGQQRYGQAGEALDSAKEVIVENLFWILPLAMIVVLLIIALIVLLTWLSSRGHFMFLHCVALNKAEIKVPWRKFKKQGNSLFLFRIVLGLISLAIIMLLIAMLIVITVLLFAGGGGPHPLGIIFMVLLAICLIIPTVIAFGLIGKFTRDFVVPIMFLRQGTCVAAWREFWPLLTGNKGRFTIYILFQIVIALAVGVIGTSIACIFSCLLFCVTCGIACCLIVIPLINIVFLLAYVYIITVLLLPLPVFGRSYSLLYLRQYGTSFDVFSPEPATTLAV